MTLTLILTRHAKSGWDDPMLADHDRPLNPRGRGDAPKVGAWLRAKGYVPDAALVSSARRTQETWDWVSAELGRAVPMTVMPSLYHAEAAVILAHLREQSAPRVMVIGHNPGIGDCAQRIVNALPAHPGFADYPTCATLVVDFPCDDWGAIGWGMGHAVDFIVPRDL
ncbi:SixA phosphatase family protein [Roseicyclus sp.]|uniref:SixA phosphatase family protein n=1 Tax=Roseicyclus sp. TaxID=1914329 RepID=UPI003F6CB85B